MNKIIAKPYVKHPFDEFKKKGAKWVKDVAKSVNTYVDRMENLLKGEADLEGQPILADEDFLYERFKDNVASGMYIANWTILKFFALKLKIKIAKEIVGEWLYTEHDVEMYRYFHSLKINITTKCQPRYLKFKFGADVNLNSIYYDDKLFAKCFIYPEGASNGEPYLWFFNDIFSCYDNLINTVKMRPVKDDDDLFNLERYKTMSHKFGTVDYKNISSDISPVYNYEFEPECGRNSAQKSLVEIVCNRFSEHCNKDAKYRELHEALVEITERLYKEFETENKGLLKPMLSDAINVMEKTAIMYASGVSNK